MNLTAVQIEARKTTDLYDSIFPFFYYIAACVAIPANLTLLVLILRRSPSSLKIYRILLLNSCITDLFFSVSITILQPRIIPNKWAFAYVALGPAKFLGSKFAYENYCVVLHSIFYTFLSFPLSFGFRYYVLVRPVPSPKNLILVLMCLWSMAITQHISFIFSEYDPHKVLEYLAENKPYYNMTGMVVSGNHIIEKPLTTLVLCTIIVPMFPIYCIVVWFYRKVRYFLDKNSESLVSETERENRQRPPASTYGWFCFAKFWLRPGSTSNDKKFMSKIIFALVIQASLPIFTVFPPITIYGMYHLELINVTIIEYLVYVLFSFYPAFSPLITIYFVKPYNRAICQLVSASHKSDQKSFSTFAVEAVTNFKNVKQGNVTDTEITTHEGLVARSARSYGQPEK